MVLFAIFALSIIFVATVAVFSTYRQARKKGYQPPAASAFVVAGFAVGIAGIIALNPANTDSMLVFLWRFFWIPVLFSSAAMFLLVLIFPHRQTQRFGQRRVRFPFRRVGQALMALAVLLPLVLPGWSMLFTGRRPQLSIGRVVGVHACACGTLPDPPGANRAHTANGRGTGGGSEAAGTLPSRFQSGVAIFHYGFEGAVRQVGQKLSRCYFQERPENRVDAGRVPWQRP
jgi:hypothetical protein